MNGEAKDAKDIKPDPCTGEATAAAHLFARLTDAGRWPRRWWHPPAPFDGLAGDEQRLRRHDEVSNTIRRVMLTLIAYAFFCVFTLIQPDKAVVGGGAGNGAETIKVPFLDFPVEFAQFLIVGPAVLIGLLVYLHIFIGNLRAIPLENRVSAMPFIFNMEARFPRVIAGFLFYWLGPLVLWLFTRKAGPHGYLLPLLLVTLATTTVMIFLQIRRAPPDRRGHVTAWALWAGFIFCGLSTLATFAQQAGNLYADATRITRQIVSLEGDPATVRPPWVRPPPAANGERPAAKPAAPPDDIQSKGGTPVPEARPAPSPAKPSLPKPAPAPEPPVQQQMQQQQAVPSFVQKALGLSRGLDLAGADLRNVDLDNRDLRGAHLTGANLAGKNLAGFNLERAKLDHANLSGAFLMQANLRKANLTNAKLEQAVLSFARLEGVMGLSCAMLEKTVFWPDAYRDPALACGQPIPQRPPASDR